MDPNSTVQIGIKPVWGGERPAVLSRVDRRQHLFIIGKSGTGKSTLLRNLLIQDIEAGVGVGLIDPHGDLTADLLDHIPPRRFNDVVYFSPADQEYPVSLNLLQHVEPHSRHLVASSVVGAFKNIWRENWGPRLQYIFHACVAALLECENTSILGVQRMLTDDRYREWVLRQTRDPSVRTFFNEFSNWDRRFAAEAVSPLQNKLGELLMDAPLRNLLSPVTGKFTPRFIMDRRRIFIANLSKGLVGEENANLLGSILVSQFQAAAMERANIPEEERTDFTLYVDEFSNFATDSFASILSELRKYRAGLVLATQYLDQCRPEIRQAIFGNVGSMVAFAVGESDAAVLSREFGGGFDPGLFSNLANGEICAKLLDHGRHAAPFLARTYPPMGKRYGKGANLIRLSRERFATPRAVVEDKIQRWMSRQM